MMETKPVRDTLPGRLRGGLLTALVLAGAAMLPASARAEMSPNEALVSQDAGAWDLVFEAENHRCRITLRTEVLAGGYAFAMPVGCRHAFPVLAMARAWMPGPADHLLFATETGQPVLDFGPTGGPSLSATASEQDVYTLMPADPARQAALSNGQAGSGEALAAAAASPTEEPPPAKGRPKKGAPAQVAAIPAAPLRQVSVAEVAGHYAVMRSGKDTGCMVTLESDARASGLKARLAPACRDQGIVIFDPAGWQLSKGRLILTARRGHSTDLILQEDGTWSNSPEKGKALVLKRL